MLDMLDSERSEQGGSPLVYRSPKHDSLMDRVQLILSLDLLLRLLSCKPLLPSDCLHCLKAPIDLSHSRTRSDTFEGSTSVTKSFILRYSLDFDKPKPPKEMCHSHSKIDTLGQSSLFYRYNF